MKNRQSFWKGSVVLLASAMFAKILGACFKIPLTNVLGGTGMGYFSSAYGLFLPIYALSIMGLSASVAQSVAQSAAKGNETEARRIVQVARLACGALGLLLSIGIFLLAEPFSVGIAAQPYAWFSVVAIAPAALFGCLTAVERGYQEGMQNMTPTAVSQAIEAAAKLVLGLLLCRWVLSNPQSVCAWVSSDVPLSALAAAAAVLGVTISTVVGWLYFLVRGLFDRKKVATGFVPQKTATTGEILRRLLYVMIPIALGSLVTNLTSLLDLVTMMRCLGRVQALYPEQLTARFGEIAKSTDFPAFVYGSFTGMAVTVWGLVPSVTNMLGKSALPRAAALWARQDGIGTAVHTKTVTVATAAMAFPATGALMVLAEPVMHVLYRGRPEEAAVAARALQAMLPGMACLCLAFPICSVCQGIGKAAIPVKCTALGVVVKLVGNLALIPTVRFCVSGAGIATSACYFVLLVSVTNRLCHVLKQPLHVWRPLLRIGAAAFVCTVTVWLCRRVTLNWNEMASLMCAALVGGAVYLLLLWLLGGRQVCRAVMVK